MSLAWLLDSDPAIRWQTLRDVAMSRADITMAETDIDAERARVAREGLGARILAAQGADGAWHREGTPDWLPTLFTMVLLRATGVEPSAVAGALDRLEAGYRWDVSFGAKPFFGGEVEPCINGGVLACGGYFGRPDHDLARRLLEEQLADGGWNCDAPKSKRSSFHTTICVLEGLMEYERCSGSTPALAEARRRAEEYLLARALFRRLSTGEVVIPEVLELAFPPRYHYSARSTTSAPPAARPTRGWPARSPSWRAAPSTGNGRSIAPTKKRPPSRATRSSASRAAGTRSAPSGSCAGIAAESASGPSLALRRARVRESRAGDLHN